MSNRVVWPLARRQRKPGPDVTFLDPDYLQRFGAWHTGEDWNGPGGGDSDKGTPIYAIADGVVVAVVKNAAPGWGNVVVIHCPQFGLWIRYAHLHTFGAGGSAASAYGSGSLAVGQQVTAGQQIGTVGKGFTGTGYPLGRWTAHLHIDAFQVDPTTLPGKYLNWPGGTAEARAEVKRVYYPIGNFWTKWKAQEPL